jgi:hypothetical protein
MTVDDVVERLERHQQRATYRAVAELLSLPNNGYNMFVGKPFSARNAWVVSEKSQLPTGYDPAKLPVNFFANQNLLLSGTDLGQWLATHP